MKRTFVALLLCCSAFSLALLQAGCRSTPPGPNGGPRFGFEAVDASCTEVWLRITLDSSIQPRTLTLKRDDEIILSDLHPLTSDTLIVDEGLLPNQSYTYTLIRPTGVGIDEVKTAQITTMDTTSSNWVFQVDTLGDGAGSVLYDVAIINDTLAYAVGAIYKQDSLGNWDPNAYNMVKWDGNTWELMRIQFLTFCDQSHTSSYPARAIFAFSETDIWIASTSQIVRWNGQTQSDPVCIPTSVNKLWGESPNSVWAVGNNGGIAHYTSGTWRRLESGTTLPIMDVYGARDLETAQYEILCVSADQALPGQSQVLKIENMAVREVATHPDWEPWSIWFVPNRRYIHAGDGLWEAYAIRGSWVRNNELPALFKTSINGQGLNDIVVGGAFWLFAHWNGVTWQSYFPRTNGAFVSVAIKGNLVLAVGGIYNKAVAIQGTR